MTLSGDISYQLYVKERQKCKPFSYFMEVVAPDMLDRYPYEEPAEFASGAIQSMADTNFCMDTLNRPKDGVIGKYFHYQMTKLKHFDNWVYRFQVCTSVQRTEFDHKTTSILHCDIIVILQRQTCKHASTVMDQKRHNR